MSARTESSSKQFASKNSHPIYVNNEGLSSKKTLFIIVTVVGCIAILWPKVFHPMMFGDSPPDLPKSSSKHRSQGIPPLGCCYNATPMVIGPHLYRKQYNLMTGEISLRQERPAHLHPDSVYQAMRERGRAIPATPTIPIVDRQGSSATANKPKYVEGRPGPLPGMRPPMGAGAIHQPQAKGSSMGFIMPLYTIGIIIFFGYTIMKVVFKKQPGNGPYGLTATDPQFRKDVFGNENDRHIEEIKSGSKLGWREHQTRYYEPTTSTATTTTAPTTSSTPLQEIHDPIINNKKIMSSNGLSSDYELYNATLSAATVANNLSTSLRQKQQQQLQQKTNNSNSKKCLVQEGVCGDNNNESDFAKAAKLLNGERDQLMEIEKLRKKLEDTERAMAKLIAEMNSDQCAAKKSNDKSTSNNNIADISSEHNKNSTEQQQQDQQGDHDKNERKQRAGSSDRSVSVLGMEVTASCEGGKKWTRRPPTPVFFHHNEHSKGDLDEDHPAPQSIYLEGTLAHESQILVSDAETKQEQVYDDFNGSEEEPAVVLSSKMTLSLINLDAHQDDKHKQNDVDSPLGDDIEIINNPYEN